MNNQRRKQIKNVISKINMIKDEIMDISMDEQLSFDNMPEGLQMSRVGMDSEYAIEMIDSAMEALDESIDKLNDVL